MRAMLLLSTCLMLVPVLLALAAPEVTVLTSEDPVVWQGRVGFAGGRVLEMSVGIGSAAYHRPGDSGDIVHALSDRGPNFACSEGVTGVARGVLCATDRNGRVYPVPGYSLTLYGRFEVFERAPRLE